MIHKVFCAQEWPTIAITKQNSYIYFKLVLDLERKIRAEKSRDAAAMRGLTWLRKLGRKIGTAECAFFLTFFFHWKKCRG